MLACYARRAAWAAGSVCLLCRALPSSLFPKRSIMLQLRCGCLAVCEERAGAGRPALPPVAQHPLALSFHEARDIAMQGAPAPLRALHSSSGSRSSSLAAPTPLPCRRPTSDRCARGSAGCRRPRRASHWAPWRSRQGRAGQGQRPGLLGSPRLSTAPAAALPPCRPIRDHKTAIWAAWSHAGHPGDRRGGGGRKADAARHAHGAPPAAARVAGPPAAAG